MTDDTKGPIDNVVPITKKSDDEEISETEFKEILVGEYGNIRSLFLMIPDDLNRFHACARLKEAFNWAIGVLNIVDEMVDNEDLEDED